MAAQVGALRVTVGADISGLQTGMKRAERQVAKSSGVMSRAVKGVNTSLSGLGSIAGVSLGGAGLLAGAAAFLKVADAAKSLQAQLKLATSEFGSFTQANKDVQRIAEVTRTGLLETANLYAVFQRNAKELGITQEQAARATETVNKTFQISGASAAEAAGGLRQFLQALQSGQLRGEEFNSIMENAPRLARLLADSLGVTIGQLRALAKEGEITGDKLVAALTDRKFTEAIDAEFKQLPVTFDQAMTQVYNAAVIVFSEFDRGGQFSNSIVNFVTDGTEGFKKLGESANQFGSDVADLFDALRSIREALGSLKTDGVLGFGSLTDATYSWRDALGDALTGVDNLINGLHDLATAPSRGIGGIFGKDSFGELFGFGPIPDKVSDLGGSFRRKTDERDLKERFRRAREASAEARNAGRVPSPFRAPAGKAKKGRTARSKAAPRDRSDDVEFQFAQELRQAQADVLRAQQSMAVTNDERARIALLLLDAEKAGKEAELNDRVRRAERDFAEKKITAGALEQVKTQADKLRAEYDSVDALERQAIANDLAAQKAQDAAALTDSAYDLRLEQLQIESSLAETAADRRAAELRILDLMKQQEKARLEAVIADQQSSELARQQAQQRLSELDNIYAGRAAVVKQGTRGPMESFKAEFGDIGEELEQLKVQGIMGAVDALGQLTQGWDSFRDAALSAIQQVLAELIRLQLMKLAVSFIGGAAGGPSGSSITALASSNNAAISGMLGPVTIPGMATGGGFNVKGIQGFDKNTLSLNGLPIANVSYGERVSVSNDNDGGMGGGFGGIHIGNITLPAGMTHSQGRQTALGFGRGLQESMGYTITGRKR